MAHSILVVDDAENTRGILTFLLKGKGYGVRAATNGEEALLQVQEMAPDLIVLDAMMPKLSGYEVCTRLKTDDKTRAIPVILLTAQSREAGETFQRWKEGLRPDHVMAKPFKIQELLARIEALLKPTDEPR